MNWDVSHPERNVYRGSTRGFGLLLEICLERGYTTLEDLVKRSPESRSTVQRELYEMRDFELIEIQYIKVEAGYRCLVQLTNNGKVYAKALLKFALACLENKDE
jgi:hypothetical protein